MGRNKKAQFDLKRKQSDVDVTINFSKQLRLLDELGYGMNARGVCELLKISKSCLERWQRQELIFPARFKAGNKLRRRFRHKDVLRAATLKYLMSELGMRKFTGVRLLLEMTNLVLAPKDADEADRSINNLRIDKYLMRILNYDIEAIALARMANNKVRKERPDDSLE